MDEAIKMRHSGKVTWGELKKMMDKAGVNDEDEIDRIDLSWGSHEEITIEWDDDFGWQVYL